MNLRVALVFVGFGIYSCRVARDHAMIKEQVGKKWELANDDCWMEGLCRFAENTLRFDLKNDDTLFFDYYFKTRFETKLNKNGKRVYGVYRMYFHRLDSITRAKKILDSGQVGMGGGRIVRLTDDTLILRGPRNRRGHKGNREAVFIRSK